MGTVQDTTSGRSLAGCHQRRFPGIDHARVRECIDRLVGLATGRPSIRREEYQVFEADQDHSTTYFEARRQEMSSNTARYLSRLVAIPRLREVRALLGFTRIEAPELDPTMEVFNEEQGIKVSTAPISAKRLEWLPAVEIHAAYPRTSVQLCVVHLVRAALRYVSTQDSKAVIADLRKIYQAATVVEAEQALEDFAQAWDAKYPTIAKVWRAKWTDIITLFDFPPAIRRAIYTTNAIESVNSVIRKFTRNRKIYPNEESALKIVYMAIHEAAKKWTMPIHHWKQALNHFAILYEGRMPENLSK